MRRLAWAAIALGATAFLIALALSGGRGRPGLETFTPKGLMAIPVEDVRQVDLVTPRGHWHFVRESDGWHTTERTAAAGFGMRLDGSLRLLRNSGPERVLNETEVGQAGPAQFGLDPPRLRVVVRASGGPEFAISFGAKSPFGLSHYARVDGSREIALLPTFVADEWERTGDPP